MEKINYESAGAALIMADTEVEVVDKRAAVRKRAKEQTEYERSQDNDAMWHYDLSQLTPLSTIRKNQLLGQVFGFHQLIEERDYRDGARRAKRSAAEIAANRVGSRLTKYDETVLGIWGSNKDLEVEIETSQVQFELEELAAAKRPLIEDSLKLVEYIARRFLRRGLSLLDLIQEGTIGLDRALEIFDPRRELQISTLAVWHIRQSIERAIDNQARSLRIPVHVEEKLRDVRRARTALTMDLMRTPTNEEVAAFMDIEISDFEDLISADRSVEYFSRQNETDDGEGDELGEEIADESDILRSIVRATTSEALWSALSELDDHTRHIVEDSLGLVTDEPKTQRELEPKYGVSRTTIGNIRNRGLADLRKRLVNKYGFEGNEELDLMA